MSDLTESRHAIPASSVKSSLPKSTILKKGKPKPKKGGLGAKRTGGLGAQKVKAIDFDELEKDAEMADKAKKRLSVGSSISDKSQKEDVSVESVRLAYKDIEIKKKQNERVISHMDEKKREQASRLGMGMGQSGGVSHNLAMQTIKQETPDKTRGRFKDEDDDIFYDASTAKPKSSWSKWRDNDSSDDDEPLDRISSKPAPPSYTITPIEDGHRPDKTMFSQHTSDHSNDRSERLRKPNAKSSSRNTTNDELNKYRDMPTEQVDSRFGTRTTYSDYSSSPQQPGDAGFRDGVKEGVRSVAGKLSSIASDIAGSIQDRYGH